MINLKMLQKLIDDVVRWNLKISEGKNEKNK